MRSQESHHCHNTILEAFFSTGLLGLVPFTLMIIYSLKWIVKSSRLSGIFSQPLTLHAACCIAGLLVTSPLESKLAVKLTLFHPLFFFYMVTLDREIHFAGVAQKSTRKELQ